MQLPKTGDLLLGKYLLKQRLGEGGMGVVFAARHTLLGQDVAVKLIRPEFLSEQEAVARFILEARASARIENEHVARVLDFGLVDQLPYMVLEFLDGMDLANVLAERGPLPVTDAVDYMMQAIDAVAHAHALGIVHRDLKPANLFIARRQSGTACLKVLDFGIAKSLGGGGAGDRGITKPRTLLGSPLYMSPEQLMDSKGVDHRCDIWSLGVVAYELLTGRPPFNGDNVVALFAEIASAEPLSIHEHRSEVAKDLDATILKALGRKPGERFESVTEFGLGLFPYASLVGRHAFESARSVLPLAKEKDPGELDRNDLKVPVGSNWVPASRLVSAPPSHSPMTLPMMPATPLSVSPVTPPPATPASGAVDTGASTERSIEREAMRGKRGWLLPMLSGGVLAGVVAGVFFGLREPAPRAHVDAPPIASSAPAASLIVAAVSPSFEATSSLQLQDAAVSASARPELPSGHAPSAGRPRGARPPASSVPSSASSVSTAPSTAPSTAAPALDCRQPYVVDTHGNKKWKPECL